MHDAAGRDGWGEGIFLFWRLNTFLSLTTVLIKSACPSFLVQDVLSAHLSPSYKGFLLCSMFYMYFGHFDFGRKRSFCCFSRSFTYIYGSLKTLATLQLQTQIHFDLLLLKYKIFLST